MERQYGYFEEQSSDDQLPGPLTTRDYYSSNLYRSQQHRQQYSSDDQRPLSLITQDYCPPNLHCSRQQHQQSYLQQ